MQRRLSKIVFVIELLEQDWIFKMIAFQDEIKFIVILSNQRSFCKNRVSSQNVIVTLWVKQVIFWDVTALIEVFLDNKSHIAER